MSIELIPGFGAFTAGGGYEAEATALFARFGTDPGTSRKDAINTCIASLKSAGVWSKLDCLYVFAAHTRTDSKLNWITNDDNITEVGALSFTTDRGFISTTTDTGTYLEGTRNLNTLTQYQQNSAHISVWCTSVLGADAASALSVPSSPVNIFPMFSDNNIYTRVNDNPESGGFATGTPSGHTLGNRSSSTAREGYRNASSIGTYGSVSSTTVPAAKIRYSIGNQAVTLNAATVGGSLNSTEVTSLYNALNTLKSAIGW